MLLKDSSLGPFTFHQLDSDSSQLVQKEYQLPRSFDASTHVMGFLPKKTDESSSYAELLVCLVQQKNCSAAAPSASRGPFRVVTRILCYDTDRFAECDVNS